MIVYDLNPEKFEKAAKLFDDPYEMLAAVIEQSTADAAQPALAAAQSTPRPSVHPFRWSYDPEADKRARNYYFAAVARGEIPTDGTRYLRSGRLGKSFDVGVQELNNSIDAVFGTKFDKASFVVGNDDGSIKQIPGHEKTGWYRFAIPAQQFTDDVVQGVERELPGVIEKRIA